MCKSMGVKMNVHRDVLETLNNAVLRDVVQIPDMSVPYQAELWVDGNCAHRDGTAMLRIADDGYLTAEYFGYDNMVQAGYRSLGLGFEQPDAKVVFGQTGIEIPIRRIAPKNSTIPAGPAVCYEGKVVGWLGDSDSEMQSVSITILGLPDIHLFRSTELLPDETTPGGDDRGFVLWGIKRQTQVLSLDADCWRIELYESVTEDHNQVHRLYHANLSRRDGSPFHLDISADSTIVDAFRSFLSFQCERLIEFPTIRCNPVFSIVRKRLTLSEASAEVIAALNDIHSADSSWPEAWNKLDEVLKTAPGFEDVSDASLSFVSPSDDGIEVSFSRGESTVQLARVSKLLAPNISHSWTASETRLWPGQFAEFWRQFTGDNSRRRLELAIKHYVECARIVEDSGVLGYSLVAAQSTLQALARWWNDLTENAYIGHGKFKGLLVQAVEKADLGKDANRAIAKEELIQVVDIVNGHRNNIDHALGRNLDVDPQAIANSLMYYRNLARLLILAKLGCRDTDSRGTLIGPRFVADMTDEGQ